MDLVPRTIPELREALLAGEELLHEAALEGALGVSETRQLSLRTSIIRIATFNASALLSVRPRNSRSVE